MVLMYDRAQNYRVTIPRRYLELLKLNGGIVNLDGPASEEEEAH